MTVTERLSATLFRGLKGIKDAKAYIYQAECFKNLTIFKFARGKMQIKNVIIKTWT